MGRLKQVYFDTIGETLDSVGFSYLQQPALTGLNTTPSIPLKPNKTALEQLSRSEVYEYTNMLRKRLKQRFNKA